MIKMMKPALKILTQTGMINSFRQAPSFTAKK